MVVKTIKLARYVRGPDGIYRRPSDVSVLTIESTNSSNPPDDLNELFDCGPIVPDPMHALPNPATHQQERDVPATNADAPAPVSNSPPDSLLTGMPPASVPPPSFNAGIKSDTPNLEKPSPNHVISPWTILPVVQYYSQRLSGLPVKRHLPHVVLFFLGMTTLYVLQAMEPTLRYWGAMMAHYAMLALIYGIVALAVLWYSGTIKFDSWQDWQKATHHLFIVSDVDSDKDKPEYPKDEPQVPKDNGVDPVLVPSPQDPPTVNAAMRMSPDISPTTASRNLSPVRDAAQVKVPKDSKLSYEKVPNALIHPQECEVTSFAPFQHTPTSVKERPKVLRVSTDIREKPNAKSKLMPGFLGEDRRHSSASLPTQKDTFRSREERLRDERYMRLNENSYREQRYKDDSRDGRDHRDRYVRASRLYKPLPPVIKMPTKEIDYDSELPLAYEVKLKNLDLGHYDLDRLGTVMSKKSVLGTRANYQKFLSNVEA